MFAGWLLFRLLRVPKAFLVAVCTLLTSYAVFSPLSEWLAEFLPGRLAGVIGVAALAAFWAWALMPGRGPRWVLLGFGVAALVYLATMWSTRVDLASAEEDDVAAADVQPYLLDSDQWELISAARAFEAPELELIYDERETGDRIVLSVTDVPAEFDPLADCYAAFPDESSGAVLSCAGVAGADDVWLVHYGNALSYLGRVGDSRVVLEPHQALTDDEAVRLLGALEPVSVQEFASADNG